MSEPTKEKMLNYLMQMSDCYVASGKLNAFGPLSVTDAHYEIVDAIRALIESSGEKESGATIKCPECGNEIEGVTCPECKNYFELGPPPEECTCQSYFERTGSHVEDCPSFTKPAPSPGPSVSYAGRDLSGVKGTPTTVKEYTFIDRTSAAPLPKEVEEAMQALDLVGEELKQLYKYRKQAGLSFAERNSADGQAALSVLKAALSKAPPAGEGVVFHAWKDGKWLGVVADPALSDRVFIGHIQSHLKEGEKVVCKICGRTAEEITGGQTVPTSGEREEMLEIIDSKMSALVSRYGWLRLADLKRNESGNPINREYETLNKIRALILAPPVSVTREWVVETTREVIHLGNRLVDEEIPYFQRRLRERGIEVGEKL